MNVREWLHQTVIPIAWLIVALTIPAAAAILPVVIR